MPILDESERKLSKELIKPHLKPRELDSAGIEKIQSSSYFEHKERRKNIVFFLEDPEIIKSNMRKIGHLLESVDELKRWLGITGYSDLEWAALSVKAVFEYNNERIRKCSSYF
ncbi:hypothetical protein LEP1GSC168_0823 [Leptospira santarosai str. HAI134]|nr:hypothetical protein LEP1GSC168_0823 [Leptospira santarosai str. HAI134]